METRLLQTKSIKLLAANICTTLILCGCSQHYNKADKDTNDYPDIYPDYRNITLPVNIAPTNFLIKNNGNAYQVAMGYKDSVCFIIKSDDGIVEIPEKEWKPLLHKAAGGDIFMRISIKNDGEWTEYADINNHVSKDTIDHYLVYRLLYPGYELWNEMGIYQRDLTNFEETDILPNRHFDKQCINCHTFNQHSTEDMMFHVRGTNGGTIIKQGTKLKKVNMKPENSKIGGAYSSWHPSGKFIAFSMNETQQFFHRSGKKPIEVSDLASNIGVYDITRNEMVSNAAICNDTYMETFPCWSPDGKTLFFCRAKAYHKDIPLDSIRYDLCKTTFDTNNRTFGAVETILDASGKKKSVSFPKVSPDGKHLIFTLSNYGNFSIWHPESDLYLLNTTNGEIKEIETINSNDVDSYHAWSSSGKWIVLSSKRINGLWARPYFAHFDTETGKTSKPFLLPQKTPLYYDDFSMTFNIPEFTTTPIKDKEKLLETINEKDNIKVKPIIITKTKP